MPKAVGVLWLIIWGDCVMSVDSEKILLGDLITYKKGFAFKSKDYVDKGIAVIRVSNFTDNSISKEDLKFVSDDVAKINTDVNLVENDIVIATVGSWPNNPASVVGRTISVPLWAKNALMNQNAVIIRAKSQSFIDQKFIYYQMKTDSFSAHIISKAQGSANQASITLNSIFSYPVNWLNNNLRTEIVNILSSLDNRISLLRETNTTLEAIAQTLFKSWFVDFDPVKAKAQGKQPEGMDEATAALFPSEFEESALGLIPKGWKCSTLSESYEINPPRKLKKGEVAPYLDMANVSTNGHVVTEVIQREMGSGTKFRNGDTLLARITPCLENGKTAFVDFLESDGTGWGSTEFVVLHPKTPLPEYHGYLLARYPIFREFAIQSMSGTSGRQRIQNDVLGRYLLAVPSNEIAMAFGNIVECIQKKISENHNQSKTLEAVRDTLLPRLISGQLRINQAQDVINEVGA